jgi:DNA-binding transcriptional MocR family regulator
MARAPGAENASQAPALRELIEKKGMSSERVAMAAARAQRTGLIYASIGPSSPYASKDASRSGANAYRVSPLLVDLARSVDFDDALRREASEPE